MTAHRPTGHNPALCLGALLAICAAPSPAGEGEVKLYECNDKGIVTFSDQPCGARQQSIELEYERPDPAKAQGAAAAARANEAKAGQIAEAELLDTEILNTQERISRLETERDGRIAGLRQQRFAGTEALDQNAWQVEMNNQIGAVAAEYQTAIDTEQTRLADLQAKRAALPSPQP